jgi:ribonucleoside-diphosphate reductase alpha chain
MSDTRSAPDNTVTVTARTGATGLEIERKFTTAGEDPFASVEWELRTAEVGGFRQEGVEFPATWSQNATNIVAQKYFRGRIGSPERE